MYLLNPSYKYYLLNILATQGIVNHVCHVIQQEENNIGAPKKRNNFWYYKISTFSNIAIAIFELFTMTLPYFFCRFCTFFHGFFSVLLSIYPSLFLLLRQRRLHIRRAIKTKNHIAILKNYIIWWNQKLFCILGTPILFLSTVCHAVHSTRVTEKIL